MGKEKESGEDENESGRGCGCLILIVVLIAAIAIFDPGFFDRVRGISPQPAARVSINQTATVRARQFTARIRATRRPTRTPRPMRTPRPTEPPIWFAEEPYTRYVISGRAFVNVRNLPSRDGDIIGTLPRGSEVTVLGGLPGEKIGDSDSWSHIMWQGEIADAFVFSPLLGRYPPPPLESTATTPPTQPPAPVPPTQAPQQQPAPDTRNTRPSASSYVNAIQSVFRTSSKLDVGVPVVSGSKGGGGFRQVTVGYWPWDSNPSQAQIRQELLAIFRLIARAMVNNGLSIDRITVTASYTLSASGGKPISSSSGNLLAWYRGQISDTVFLNRLN